MFHLLKPQDTSSNWTPQTNLFHFEHTRIILQPFLKQEHTARCTTARYRHFTPSCTECGLCSSNIKRIHDDTICVLTQFFSMHFISFLSFVFECFWYQFFSYSNSFAVCLCSKMTINVYSVSKIFPGTLHVSPLRHDIPSQRVPCGGKKLRIWS